VADPRSKLRTRFGALELTSLYRVKIDISLIHWPILLLNSILDLSWTPLDLTTVSETSNCKTERNADANRPACLYLRMKPASRCRFCGGLVFAFRDLGGSAVGLALRGHLKRSYRKALTKENGGIEKSAQALVIYTLAGCVYEQYSYFIRKE
jgi:hypothetical protein